MSTDKDLPKLTRRAKAMKSPFPGMDPYLEHHWQDVHTSLIIYTRDQLEEQLPGNLIARVEERLVVEADEIVQRSIYPDVRIAEDPKRRPHPAHRTGKVAVADPIVLQLPAEPAVETYIEILEAEAGYRLVTVLEILSQANKLPGESQQLYRRKQKELNSARVSLVEIDLLRSGQRVLSLPLSEIPRNVQTTYQICVHRGWAPGAYELYPVPLQKPLPTFRIPLRQRDKDAHLNLQAIVDQAYRKGRYYATIDYQEPPVPPLKAEEAKWAKSVIRKAKRLSG